jgi:hypothetical protein
MLYTVRFFSSSKCNLFHNTNIFGSSNIHILCKKWNKKKKKNNFGSKRLTASCLSVCPYVHPHLTTRFPTGWIFMKFDIWVFFEKSVDKIQVPVKSDTNKAHFTCRPTDVYGKVSLQSSWNEKCFRQKLQRKSKHKFWCSVISFFFRKSCLLRDNMEKNFVEWGRPQITIWRVRVACRVHKAKSTDSSEVKEINGRGDPLRWPRDSPLSAKVGTSFADRRRPLCRPRLCRAVAPLDYYY